MILLIAGETAPADQLAAALWMIIPEGSCAAFARASEPAPPLFREEEPFLSGAVPRRQREFAQGRWCARMALAQLGAQEAALPVRPDRSPGWPKGFVGSITHCDGLVAAVAATETRLDGIGLDVEQATPLGDDLVPIICRPEEIGWIEVAPAPPSANWAKVIFSAKESVHKCIAPRSGVMLDFRDVTIAIDPASGTFRASLAVGDGSRLPDFSRIIGRFVNLPDFVWTSAIISAPGKLPQP